MSSITTTTTSSSQLVTNLQAFQENQQDHDYSKDFNEDEVIQALAKRELNTQQDVPSKNFSGLGMRFRSHNFELRRFDPAEITEKELYEIEQVYEKIAAGQTNIRIKGTNEFRQVILNTLRLGLSRPHSRWAIFELLKQKPITVRESNTNSYTLLDTREIYIRINGEEACVSIHNSTVQLAKFPEHHFGISVSFSFLHEILHPLVFNLNKTDPTIEGFNDDEDELRVITGFTYSSYEFLKKSLVTNFSEYQLPPTNSAFSETDLIIRHDNTPCDLPWSIKELKFKWIDELFNKIVSHQSKYEFRGNSQGFRNQCLNAIKVLLTRNRGRNLFYILECCDNLARISFVAGHSTKPSIVIKNKQLFCTVHVSESEDHFDIYKKLLKVVCEKGCDHNQESRKCLAGMKNEFDLEVNETYLPSNENNILNQLGVNIQRPSHGGCYPVIPNNSSHETIEKQILFYMQFDSVENLKEFILRSRINRIYLSVTYKYASRLSAHKIRAYLDKLLGTETI